MRTQGSKSGAGKEAVTGPKAGKGTRTVIGTGTERERERERGRVHEGQKRCEEAQETAQEL